MRATREPELACTLRHQPRSRSVRLVQLARAATPLPVRVVHLINTEIKKSVNNINIISLITSTDLDT